METLKEVKEALNKIPDLELEGMHFGVGEGTEEEISVVAVETGALGKNHVGFPEVFEKYPDINKLNKLIYNIIKAQRILDEQDEKAEKLTEELTQEGITDTFFDKKK